MRRILVAITSVAVVLAACTGGDGVESTSTSSTTTTTTAPSTTTTTEPDPGGPRDPAELGRRWSVGDCVRLESFEDLPYEPFGGAFVVPCDESHTMEVYFTGSFDDGPFPGDAASEAIREACAAGFLDYVGTSYLASGLDIVLYLPDEREWADGLRYQACVVYDPRAGDPPTSTGSFEGVGDAVPFPASVGDCSNDVALREEGIACDLPHRYEHAGAFTPTFEAWPGTDVLEERVVEGCRSIVDGYVVGGSGVPIGAVIGFPAATPTEADWEAGFRSVVCVATAIDAVGEGLVVIGSFAEPGWTVVEAGQVA
ncbi:MAG: septum formation family protein [Acidimicrobiia bacterium]|nr:septum formation family protein [Acidimicrobiia bacterium]